MSDTYRISELAKRAGVSVRTVRYYIQEGLLPAPERKGRHTTYSAEHLDRLRLIAALKDAYLPLDEIRVRLEGLSHTQVRDLLDSTEAEDPLVMREETTPFLVHSASDIMGAGFVSPISEMGHAEAHSEPPADSAKEYVRRVLEDRPRPAPSAMRRARQTPPPVGSTEWERHEIADGVEIHVRQPVDYDARKKLSRLLALARDVFRE